MEIEEPELSVIIPIYNEENSLEILFQKVKKAKPIDKEIILVDDSSTDKSQSILEEISYESRTKVIKHSKNIGKGSAVKTGIKYARGKIILIQDADLEYDPNEYEKIIKPIKEEKANVVYGSRFLKEKNNKKGKLKFYCGNKFLSLITNIIYGTKITDMETCYKALKTEVIMDLELKSKGFELEPEITSKLLRKGYKIYEVAISYDPRTSEEGKKIGMKDGFTAIKTLIHYRLV